VNDFIEYSQLSRRRVCRPGPAGPGNGFGLTELTGWFAAGSVEASKSYLTAITALLMSGSGSRKFKIETPKQGLDQGRSAEGVFQLRERGRSGRKIHSTGGGA
jgi:hypothetical protein